MISGAIAILNANSALTTALGSSKIYPVAVPSDVATPYLAVGLMSDGTGEIKNTTDRIGYPSFYVNVHANDYDEIESLSLLVKAALNGQTGVSAGTTFQKIWCVNAQDRPDLYKPEGNIYCRTIHFNTIIKK